MKKHFSVDTAGTRHKNPMPICQQYLQKLKRQISVGASSFYRYFILQAMISVARCIHKQPNAMFTSLVVLIYIASMLREDKRCLSQVHTSSRQSKALLDNCPLSQTPESYTSVWHACMRVCVHTDGWAEGTHGHARAFVRFGNSQSFPACPASASASGLSFSRSLFTLVRGVRIGCRCAARGLVACVRCADWLRVFW